MRKLLIIAMLALVAPARGQEITADQFRVKVIPHPNTVKPFAYVTGSGSDAAYYWLSVVYPNGETRAIFTYVTGIPGTLDGSHYVTLRWNTVAGASSYRVYKTTTSAYPSGGTDMLCSTTGSTCTDNGSALISGDPPSPAAPEYKTVITTPGGNPTITGHVRDAGGQVYNPKAYGAAADGTSDDSAAINSAITDANAAGGGTVLLAGGTFAVASSISLKSNVTVRCEAAGGIKQLAGATPAVHFSALSNAGLENCKINGNGQTANAVLVDGASSEITIAGNEILDFGGPLPSSNNGILVSGTAADMSKIRITGNKVHDGNNAIFLQASGGHTIKDITIRDNQMYANANGALTLWGTATDDGVFRNVQVISNSAWCNGWPAGGTGFPATCTAGTFQTGGTASSNPVAYNFNNADIQNLLVVGNISRDHPLDGGYDFTPRTLATVNTSGTSVTWSSGNTFDTGWPANSTVLINGTSYLIASVASSTSLTLATSAGTQTGVTFNGPRTMNATVVGNTSLRDKVGFFVERTLGINFAGNRAIQNLEYPFQVTSSNNISFSGDVADSGYMAVTACNNVGWCGIGSDSSAFNIQAIKRNPSSSQTGLAYINGSVNATIVTRSEQTAVTDNTATTPFVMVNRLIDAASQLCFAGSGTGCITSSLAGSNTMSTFGAAGTSSATVDHSVPVKINGTTYYILLSTTP